MNVIKEKTTKNGIWTAMLTNERGGYYVKVILHPNGRDHATARFDFYMFYETKTKAMEEYRKQIATMGK